LISIQSSFLIISNTSGIHIPRVYQIDYKNRGHFISPFRVLIPPAVTLDEALEEILSNSGSKYDPKVVDACLRLMREKGFHLDES
jgi:hypothetical protein